MNDRDRVKAEIAAMSDEAIQAKLDAKLFGSFGGPIARRELAMREAARVHAKMEADRRRQNAKAARQAEAEAQRWQAEHALTERNVIAAEEAARAAAKQATYAKRAFERSNVAIWVSVATAIVMGFLALLDYLTPG